MVTHLIDSAIVIDILRDHAPATQWLLGQNITQLGISKIIWLEIVEGASNKREQQTAVRLLRQFSHVPLLPEDVDWATDRMMAYWLSHNVGAFDCLIAAPAHRLQLPLYTRNLKHFAPLLGSLAQTPY